MTTPRLVKLHELMAHERLSFLDTYEAFLRELAPEVAVVEKHFDVAGPFDEVLGALKRDAEAGGASNPPLTSTEGERRGRRRCAAGVGIATLVREYGALCDAVCTELASRGFSCSAREFEVMNDALDACMVSAVEAYFAQARTAAASETQTGLGMLTHELRNALTSATWAFRLISERQGSGENKAVGTLSRGLRRMRDLLDRTLWVVRLKAGVDLHARPLRVVELLRQAALDVVLDRDVTIHVDADDALEMEADPELLLSALGNLLGNAVKFSRNGAVIVARADGAGDDVVIEVKDGCGGLPACQREELFKPFVQGVSGRGGVGLGLAIVQGVVEAHGGQITVEDLPGVGCVFAMKLPRRQRRSVDGERA